MTRSDNQSIRPVPAIANADICGGLTKLLGNFSEVDISSAKRKSPTLHVYILLAGERIVYIGRTSNLLQRIATHFYGTYNHEPKTFDRALTLEVPRHDAAALEGALIRRFDPPLCDGAPADESRDREMLASLGIEYDQAARDRFVSRYRQIFVDGHRKSRVRDWSRRRWYGARRFERVLWKATTRYLAKLEDA